MKRLLIQRSVLGVAALFAALSALAFAPSARALPLSSGLEGKCKFAGCDIAYWDPAAGGNGHYYAYVPTGDMPATWAQARDAASGSNLGVGSQGYLATIGSALENQFIVNEILPLPSSPNKKLVWLGGQQIDTKVKSLPAAAGWQWVTPESWTYANWSAGEPNDEGVAGGDERYLTMWVHYFIAGVDKRGTWNDEGPESQSEAASLGFIVEFEAASIPAPEPGAALLALLGAALVARRARR